MFVSNDWWKMEWQRTLRTQIKPHTFFLPVSQRMTGCFCILEGAGCNGLKNGVSSRGVVDSHTETFFPRSDSKDHGLPRPQTSIVPSYAKRSKNFSRRKSTSQMCSRCYEYSQRSDRARCRKSATRVRDTQIKQ